HAAPSRICDVFRTEPGLLDPGAPFNRPKALGAPRRPVASRSPMKPLLIVNPRSGGGRTGQIFDKLRRPIERSIGAFDTMFTERGRHAVDLAREAALAGRETVVAVGGD